MVRIWFNACRVTTRMSGTPAGHLPATDRRLAHRSHACCSYVRRARRRTQHLVGNGEKQSALGDERVLGDALDPATDSLGRTASGIAQASGTPAR